MPRIQSDAPGIRVVVEIGQTLGTAMAVLAEAPDFEVPNPSSDSVDDTVVVPGQVRLETPLMVFNSDTVARWVEVELLAEGGAQRFLARLTVPAGEWLPVPVQGQIMVKRVAAGANGGRLRARAQTAGVVRVVATAVEAQSDAHAPLTAVA